MMLGGSGSRYQPGKEHEEGSHGGHGGSLAVFERRRPPLVCASPGRHSDTCRDARVFLFGDDKASGRLIAALPWVVHAFERQQPESPGSPTTLNRRSTLGPIVVVLVLDD
jgi:hypothetical protein